MGATNFAFPKVLVAFPTIATINYTYRLLPKSGNKMIITKVAIHNLFNFDHAELDLTIPKKVVNSTIPFEYLEGREAFRYRRVCILSGANASGKTSLGRVLNFLQRCVAGDVLPAVEDTRKYISDKTQPAEMTVEFVTPSNFRIHQLQVNILPQQPLPDILYASTYIEVNASSSKAREKLQKVLSAETPPKRSRRICTPIGGPSAWIELLEELNTTIPGFGWKYHVTRTQEVSVGTVTREEGEDVRIFSAVLKTFDPSVEAILISKDDEGMNGFTIKFSNGDRVLLDTEGKVTNADRLSRGTLEATVTASFLSRMLRDRQYPQACNTYFIDEAMAYAHPELEQAMVNLLIEKLGRNSQLFYTTHNYEVLSMNLPTHSFVFLKKEWDKVSFVQPEKTFKRNDRSLLNYIQNDVFGTLPDTMTLDDLLWED